MKMTKEERIAKKYLQRLLATGGYKTYAKILSNFDFNYTNDPQVVAYMVPGEGLIVVNRGLSAEQSSVVVRHEILHEYLKHEKRLLDHIAKKMKDEDSNLKEVPLNELKNRLYGSDSFNVAADYEISNRGYTDKDKDTVRRININGMIVSGLVTEDGHPDWVNMSVEEMYDKLEEERANIKPEDMKVNGVLMDDVTFVDPFTGAIYGI